MAFPPPHLNINPAHNQSGHSHPTPPCFLFPYPPTQTPAKACIIAAPINSYYVYIYIYMCIYICIYVYIYICIYKCTYKYIYIYICIYVYTRVHMYFHISIYINMCVYMYICAYVYVYIYIHTNAYIYIHLYMGTCVVYGPLYVHRRRCLCSRSRSSQLMPRISRSRSQETAERSKGVFL